MRALISRGFLALDQSSRRGSSTAHTVALALTEAGGDALLLARR